MKRIRGFYSWPMLCLLALLPLPATIFGSNIIANLNDKEQFYEKFIEPKIISHAPIRTDTVPLLIYYVIDTEEPFMQISVDIELRALKGEGCTAAGRQNWMAFVNSQFTKHQGSITFCRNGRLAPPIILATIRKKIYDSIQYKIKFLSDPGFPVATLRSLLEFPEEISAKANQYRTQYKSYPLANADVMHALLKFSEEVFPVRAYTRFLHFKGHAVRAKKVSVDNIVLTGLDRESLATKTALQKAYLSDSDHGEQSNSLGYYALGSYGLDSDSYFGISVHSFRRVLETLTEDESERSIALVTLEACTAEITKDRMTRLLPWTYRMNLNAIYMPTGFLAYRNFQWDKFLSQPGIASNSRLFFDQLIDAARRVINYYIIEP